MTTGRDAKADQEVMLANTGQRVASLARETGETTVSVTVNLDGQGRYDVDTGNGFLDHMVSQVARHGLFDITLKAQWRPSHRVASPGGGRGHSPGPDL